MLPLELKIAWPLLLAALANGASVNSSASRELQLLPYCGSITTCSGDVFYAKCQAIGFSNGGGCNGVDGYGYGVFYCVDQSGLKATCNGNVCPQLPCLCESGYSCNADPAPLSQQPVCGYQPCSCSSNSDCATASGNRRATNFCLNGACSSSCPIPNGNVCCTQQSLCSNSCSPYACRGNPCSSSQCSCSSNADCAQSRDTSGSTTSCLNAVCGRSCPYTYQTPTGGSVCCSQKPATVQNGVCYAYVCSSSSPSNNACSCSTSRDCAGTSDVNGPTPYCTSGKCASACPFKANGTTTVCCSSPTACPAGCGTAYCPKARTTCSSSCSCSVDSDCTGTLGPNNLATPVCNQDQGTCSAIAPAPAPSNSIGGVTILIIAAAGLIGLFVAVVVYLRYRQTGACCCSSSNSATAGKGGKPSHVTANPAFALAVTSPPPASPSAVAANPLAYSNVPSNSSFTGQHQPSSLPPSLLAQPQPQQQPQPQRQQMAPVPTAPAPAPAFIMAPPPPPPPQAAPPTVIGGYTLPPGAKVTVIDGRMLVELGDLDLASMAVQQQQQQRQ